MENEIKGVITEILNDRFIFFYSPGAELFGKQEMHQLKKNYNTSAEEFIKVINGKIKSINVEIENKNQELQNTRNYKHKTKIKRFITNRENCLKLAHSMVNNSSNSFVMKRLMDYFDDFGILSCKLKNSTLDDIRKVIEETDLQITEEYILYKIKKDKRAKMPLKRLLGYIEKLYVLNISLTEIAFIIGKLNSFIELPLVMINE